MSDTSVGSTVSVLHLIASTRRRGAEIFAVELAEALGGHGMRGEVVSLEGGGSLTVDHVGRGRFDPHSIRVLRSRIRRSTVVVAHGSSTLLAAGIACFGTGVPFVYRNIGDPDFWVHSGLRSWRVGMLMRRAAAVVALWPTAAERLVARHHLDPDRVAIAGNGVPVARFPVATAEERMDARTRLGLPSHGVVLAFVGSLSAEKDPVTAVRGAAGVEGAHLAIVGDGPLRADLERLSATLLPGRTTFFAAVEDVRPVLAAADAIVLTSRTEGLPGVLVEAGLTGTPAVATRVGGVPEIVRGGVSGELVPVADPAAVVAALGRVLGARESMGAAARAHCEANFGLEEITARWAAVLRHTVDDRYR